MLNELLKEILHKRPSLLGLEDVIEKEILHHDLMTLLHKLDLLPKLTFIGGTALRLCYNSNRLSEDLDFTAGVDFKAKQFAGLGDEIQKHLKLHHYRGVG
jgi:predicted nucleotidyltransferase component of viral defense system